MEKPADLSGVIPNLHIPDYENNPEIKWNFTKFLISRDGERIERFAPTIPMARIERCIEEML